MALKLYGATDGDLYSGASASRNTVYQDLFMRILDFFQYFFLPSLYKGAWWVLIYYAHILGNTLKNEVYFSDSGNK